MLISKTTEIVIYHNSMNRMSYCNDVLPVTAVLEKKTGT
jgi:hypothetical protein